MSANAKVIPMPPRAKPEEPSADHDLLVRIDERVKTLGEQVVLMGTNINTRVETNEDDIQWVKSKIYMALGALAIINILFALAIGYILKHLP